ncbi:MGMT family protein [Tessaracoccus sp.]|uniref:MGMT family protein n=1 Tax=Tessaracoccus sp. TaxID=1971211 RepID=UPI00261E07B6|nr:MGMT family protein [Tessaracoccus sp.]
MSRLSSGGIVEDTVERVLRVVESVPPGRVVSYGDIAELVGSSPRRVGAIMAARGSAVPWWRVTNAAGRMPSHLVAEAQRHWVEELTPLRPDGDSCRMSAARADLISLAASAPT